MKIMMAIALAVLPLRTAFAAPDARHEMQRGDRLFQKGEFSAAAGAYESAANGAGALDLDPAAPLFNSGLAKWRAGDQEAAVSAFLAATRTPDLKLQRDAFYNAGTARLLHVQQNLQHGSASNVLDHLAQAIDGLDRALLLQPDRADARHNLEIALAYRAALLNALARLTGALSTAGRQVAQHQFPEAHETLAQAGKELAHALPLKPDTQKKFEQLLERTGQIADILKSAGEQAVSP